MLKTLVLSLLLTLLLEEALALLWGLRGRRELILVALVNCLTNPPVVLLYHAFHLPALPLELAAMAVEWLCYRAFSGQLRRPLAFSVCANAFSFGAGCGLRFLAYILFL